MDKLVIDSNIYIDFFNSGKFADLAGHDINYLALSGVLDLMGERDGPPSLAGIQIADLAGGSMQAVIGILLALQARERTGKGQRVDVSMFAGSAALMPVPLAALEEGHASERGNEMLCGRFACYHVYAAAGGSYVAVGALEPKFWANLCQELGCADLIAPSHTEIGRQLYESLKDGGRWEGTLPVARRIVSPAARSVASK
jgi:crotonobetainyl-CoA:carnitine CoA-transferase CaiB-like acyl-CoA transferase